MMWKDLPTPCYVVDEGKIRKNLEILADLEQECGCHILLAQKAFSMYSLYPMIGQYISGTTASGLYEARLGYEEMGKENHVFAPAYKEKDMEELTNAEFVVAILDFEHQTIDPGTAYELGVATMLKKPMIIVQEETVPTNLMITQSLHTYLKSDQAVREYDFETLPVETYVGEYL